MSKLADHIFWLNLTEKGKDNLLDNMKILQLPETLDELGLGVLRDYFADLFFPGTTTVMTRARYFMFIPAIYYYFEKHNIRIKPDDIRKKQNELREKLVRSCDRVKLENRKDYADACHGIIGAVSREQLIRWPDEIYWNGMVVLGIFQRLEFSRRYYINCLCRQEEKVLDDDKNVQGEPGLLDAWSFPYEELEDMYYERGNVLREDISLKLTKKESLYLKDKLMQQGDSLYPQLLRSNKKYDEKIFWKIPGITEKKMVKDAKKFSLFSRGLWLSYYYLLKKKKGLIDDADKCLSLFSEWHKRAKPELINWNFKSFAVCIKGSIKESLINYIDFSFLEETYKNIIAAGNPDKVLFSNEQHIVDREKRIKGNRARLSNEHAMKEWDGEISIKEDKQYHYDYRWESPVRDIINDIIKGLNNV